MFVTMKAPDKDDGCHSDRKAFVAYAWMPANMPRSLLSLSSDDKMERSMALGVLVRWIQDLHLGINGITDDGERSYGGRVGPLKATGSLQVLNAAVQL